MVERHEGLGFGVSGFRLLGPRESQFLLLLLFAWSLRRLVVHAATLGIKLQILSELYLWHQTPQDSRL